MCRAICIASPQLDAPAECSSPTSVLPTSRPRRSAVEKVHYEQDAYEPRSSGNSSVFRLVATTILRGSSTPLPWKLIFRLASVHPEASTILLQSKGKTPSNSMCSAFNKDVQKGVDVTVAGVHGVCRLGKHFVRMPSPTGSGSVYDLKERYVGRMIPVDANLRLDDDCTASTSTKRSASECVSDEPERCVRSRSASFASAVCSDSSTESDEEEAELLLGFYTSALDLLAITAVDEAERSPRCIVESTETMRHELSHGLHPTSQSACSPRPRLARSAIRGVAPTQC